LAQLQTMIEGSKSTIKIMCRLNVMLAH